MRKALAGMLLTACAASVRAQAPLAAPLADFDKLVSQLGAGNVVGTPMRAGESMVIPFAAIHFQLGAAGKGAIAGGGMNAKTIPLGVLIVEGDDARAELFPVEEPKLTLLQQVLQAVLDRKLVFMANGVNVGNAPGKLEDLAPIVASLSALNAQTTVVTNGVNVGSMSAPRAAAPPAVSLNDLEKLYDDRKYQPALAAADRLIAGNPKDAGLHVWRGRILGALAQGDLGAMMEYGPGAMQEFEKALALDPENADAHLGRGMGRMKAPEGFGKDLDGAVADFEAAAAKKPSANAYFQLGEALRAKRLNSRAAASYQKALALDPQDARASKALAALSGESR